MNLHLPGPDDLRAVLSRNAKAEKLAAAIMWTPSVVYENCVSVWELDSNVLGVGRKKVTFGRACWRP